MHYVLVKYKHIKLLINEGCDSQPLLKHLADIEALYAKVAQFYENLMTVDSAEGAQLDKEKRQLISKIGYNITGVPFTNQDAELYAINNKLEFNELCVEIGYDA